MYTVDMYRRVRRAHFVEGMSIREAARVFGLHRDYRGGFWLSRCRRFASPGQGPRRSGLLAILPGLGCGR